MIKDEKPQDPATLEDILNLIVAVLIVAFMGWLILFGLTHFTIFE